MSTNQPPALLNENNSISIGIDEEAVKAATDIADKLTEFIQKHAKGKRNTNALRNRAESLFKELSLNLVKIDR